METLFRSPYSSTLEQEMFDPFNLFRLQLWAIEDREIVIRTTHVNLSDQMARAFDVVQFNQEVFSMTHDKNEVVRFLNQLWRGWTTIYVLQTGYKGKRDVPEAELFRWSQFAIRDVDSSWVEFTGDSARCTHLTTIIELFGGKVDRHQGHWLPNPNWTSPQP